MTWRLTWDQIGALMAALDKLMGVLGDAEAERVLRPEIADLPTSGWMTWHDCQDWLKSFHFQSRCAQRRIADSREPQVMAPGFEMRITNTIMRLLLGIDEMARRQQKEALAR